MAKKKSKVRKYNRGKRINAGFIIFAFVFIYIVVFVVNYLFKEQISIYEVTTAQIADNNTFSGVAIREEITINTPAAGYVTYYFSSGTLAAVNDGLFSINEGAMADQIIAENEEKVIRDSDYLNIRREINNFYQGFDESDFSEIYNFKAQLNSMIFDAKSGATTTNMDELLAQMEAKGVNIIKSPSSAIASNTIDNMIGISVSSLNDDSFDSEKYTNNRINTGDLLEKDAPAVKLVTNDKWSIAIKLDEKQYEKIKELNTVTILLKKYNIKTNVSVESFNKNGSYYGILHLNKYMANYIDDRYIDLEIMFNYASGLKIPNTAITKKDFYLVPYEYLTIGGNTSNYGVTKIVYDKNGNSSYEFINVRVYYLDENNNAYLDSNLFEAGTVLAKTDSKDKFTLASKAPLQGVYIVNQGYFDFRRIEVIYDNNEYSIVSEETEYGLHVYDQIVSDAETAKDDAVIY